MKGFIRFLGKDLLETVRTWRLPVVGGTVLVFALSGPVMALFTPQLLESMQASQPGVVIKVPDPVYRDAYLQWLKNLSQIVAFVGIIAAAGSVSTEVTSGTANLVLTKPVSRSSFVIAKWFSFVMLLVATVVAGTALTQAITLALFGRAPAAGLWPPTAVWLLYAVLLVTVSTLMSTRLPTLAAAGVSIGVFFALSLGGLWGPLVRYTPVGLGSAPGGLATGGHPDLAWPIATGFVAIAALLALACWLFERREL